MRGCDSELKEEVNKRSSKPVSRVLCPDYIGMVTISLGPMLPSGSSGLPGNGPGVPCSLYLALLRMGFTKPTGRPVAGELLPRHFTLIPTKAGTVCFCGTFRRVTPPGSYPVPRLVELGLSSLTHLSHGGHPVYLARIHSTPCIETESNLTIRLSPVF